MKVKSLRKLLNAYSTILSVTGVLSLIAMLPVYELFRTRSNSLTAMGLSALMLTVILYLISSLLNKALIKEYNVRLSQDAHELAQQLKGSKYVDTDVLKEILVEMRSSREESEEDAGD